MLSQPGGNEWISTSLSDVKAVINRGRMRGMEVDAKAMEEREREKRKKRGSNTVK